MIFLIATSAIAGTAKALLAVTALLGVVIGVFWMVNPPLPPKS